MHKILRISTTKKLPNPIFGLRPLRGFYRTKKRKSTFSSWALCPGPGIWLLEPSIFVIISLLTGPLAPQSQNNDNKNLVEKNQKLNGVKSWIMIIIKRKLHIYYKTARRDRNGIYISVQCNSFSTTFFLEILSKESKCILNMKCQSISNEIWTGSLKMHQCIFLLVCKYSSFRNIFTWIIFTEVTTLRG